MSPDKFIYKTQVNFSITSGDINPDIITKELNIIPEKSFKKGDISVSKHSGSVITKPYNLWSIQSKITFLEEEKISHHIEFFKSLFLPKVEILKKYKQDSRFEVSFYIWVETNNSGIGFDLWSEEIVFLNSISNKVHFSMLSIADKSIEQ